MKYFIDTEFLEPDMEQMEAPIVTPPVLLISIGIVSEDGREYYAQDDFMSDIDLSEFPSWHQENVMPYLLKDAWRPRATIRSEVEAFINAGEGTPEFIFWCGCYDYVILCQLFGGMLKLPAGWPHSIIDLQETLNKHKITDDMLPQQPEMSHNALSDARYIKLLWEWPTVTGAAPRHWLSDEVVRDRMFYDVWLSDQKPLILRNDPGPKHTGGSIPPGQWAIVEDPGPKSEMAYGGEAGATILPSKIGGQREGKTHVHVHLDSEEITPEDWKLLGGYVGHQLYWGDPVLHPEYVPAAKDLAAIADEPLPLPDGMTEEEAQQVFLPPVTDAQELQTFTPQEPRPAVEQAERETKE